MDYKKAAQQVLDNIGGASNIVSAAITRRNPPAPGDCG